MKPLTEITKILSKSSTLFNQDFLKQLLTPSELEALERRWCIVRMLDDGLAQRKIAKNLHTSLCNITRGSRELKKKNSAFQQALKIIKEV